MEIKNIKQNIKIQLLINIDSDKCETIKQENIVADNDNLIFGIYRIKIIDSDVYIVCCNRGDSTLDYTKLCATIEQANIEYKKMLLQIEYDLNN